MKLMEMKNIINNLLKPLDAEIYALNETRDILTGRIPKDYSFPYEAIVAFPASMGERGKNFSMYYDDIPEAKQIYDDFRKDLRSSIKSNHSNTGYDEQIAKIARKVLKIKVCG